MTATTLGVEATKLERTATTKQDNDKVIKSNVSQASKVVNVFAASTEIENLNCRRSQLQ